MEKSQILERMEEERDLQKKIKEALWQCHRHQKTIQASARLVPCDDPQPCPPPSARSLNPALSNELFLLNVQDELEMQNLYDNCPDDFSSQFLHELSSEFNRFTNGRRSNKYL